MSKVYTDVKHPEKVIPARVEKRHTGKSCDICGVTCSDRGSNWSNHMYYKDSIKVRRVKGDVYPEDQFLNEHRYDICPKCFEDKLIPFLEGLGAKGEYREL